jgi:hypothetical protein
MRPKKQKKVIIPVIVLLIFTISSFGQDSTSRSAFGIHYGTSFFPDSYFKYELNSNSIGFGRLSYVDFLGEYRFEKNRMFNPAIFIGFQKGEYLQHEPSGMYCVSGIGIQNYNRVRLIFENKFQLIDKNKYNLKVFTNVQIIFANHNGSAQLIDLNNEKKCYFYNSNRIFFNPGIGFESSFKLSSSIQFHFRNSFEYLPERMVMNSALHLGLTFTI